MKFRAIETHYNGGNIENEKEVTVNLVVFRDSEIGLSINGIIVLYLVSAGNIMISSGTASQLEAAGLPTDNGRILVTGL